MKLAIIDRDGVINHDSDAFIKSPQEWEAIPGSLEALARLTRMADPETAPPRPLYLRAPDAKPSTRRPGAPRTAA